MTFWLRTVDDSDAFPPELKRIIVLAIQPHRVGGTHVMHGRSHMILQCRDETRRVFTDHANTGKASTGPHLDGVEAGHLHRRGYATVAAEAG